MNSLFSVLCIFSVQLKQMGILFKCVFKLRDGHQLS